MCFFHSRDIVGTFQEVKKLPIISKVIAGAVFPVAVLAALVLQRFVEIDLSIGFGVVVALTVLAVVSSMQLHFVIKDDER